MGLTIKDFDLNPRIAYGTVDMGIDEFFPHFYITGDKVPAGHIKGTLVGVPGCAPLGLWCSFELLTSPMSTTYGLWYLDQPLYFIGPLGSISSNGYLQIETIIPPMPLAPYDVFFQAMIGDVLTQLYVMEVR